jgi:CSLREA domain-containing protein/uncharacterized repeat protein (TIGR01451 family)
MLRMKPTRSSAFALMLPAVLSGIFAASLEAVTITVNSTADVVANDGQCTLREAIVAANTNTSSGAMAGECAAGSPGLDTIAFSLPAGVQTIGVTSLLPDITEPLLIDGYTKSDASANTLAVGDNAVINVVLKPSPPSASVNGLKLALGSSGSTIRGLYFQLFAGSAIIVEKSDNDVIVGNFMGINNATPIGFGDGVGAIALNPSSLTPNPSNTRIGGTTPAERNVIASANYDIEVDAATGTVIEGNYLGTFPNGTSAPPLISAQGAGIYLLTAPGTTIGGTTGVTVGGGCTGACNLISGNNGGINTFSSASSVANLTIQGNFVGPDATGTAALGNNAFPAILISDKLSSVQIGGTTAAARNIISGCNGTTANIYIGHFNAPAPVAVTGSAIQGNYIGLNSAGTATLTNTCDGIILQNAAGFLVGGPAAGAGNVIAGHNRAGIRLDGAQGNLIQGNFIGTLADGTTAAANAQGGVVIEHTISAAATTDGNTIGGSSTAAGDRIAFNTGAGISATAGVNNLFSHNSIFQNSTLGIDLGPGGATNDHCDPDTGPNNLQNFPVLATATTTGSSVTITGSLDSVASTMFTIEFFSNPSAHPDQGKTFLGSTAVTTGGGCTAAINATFAASVAVGDRITATATDPNNNTSEFSAPVTVAAAPPLNPPTVSKSFTPPSIPAGGASLLTITLSNSNAVPLTGAAFTDSYPANLVNTASPAGATTCAGGTVTAAAGGGSVALSGGTIPASGSCTVTVNVTSAMAGSYLDTIPQGAVTTANAPANTAPASATLVVTPLSPPTVSKSFTPPTIAPGGTSVLTITLSNSNSVPITGASFTDSYPANLVNTASPAGATTCAGGAVTAAAGGGSVALSGGTVPASGSCTVTVNVTSAMAGNYSNTIPPGGVTTANAGPNADPAAATLAVAAAMAAVPTLSEWGLLLLGLLLALAAVAVLRRG